MVDSNEHPLVRIADALDRLAIMLERMQHPPLMVRGLDATGIVGDTGKIDIVPYGK